MTRPILIYSDPHYHNFSQFAVTNKDGINSRLASTIKATEEAVDHLIKERGHLVICAGDLFHTRGTITPSVFNPVQDMFNRLKAASVWSLLLSGNHDLESDRSKDLTSAITALASGTVHVFAKEEGEDIKWGDSYIKMIPWNPDLRKLRTMLKIDSDAVDAKNKILVLHAPLNGVVSGLPDHGLTPDDFEDCGYDAVFIGHYHNHKVFTTKSGCKVVSVGSLTHQNWGDTESRAGYILYYPDDNRIEQYETKAPKFMKVDIDDIDHADVVDNFVKVTGGAADATEAEQIRNDLLLAGARGVIVEGIAKKPAVSRGTATTGTPTLQSILSDYIDRTYPGDTAVKVAALDILGEIYD